MITNASTYNKSFLSPNYQARVQALNLINIIIDIIHVWETLETLLLLIVTLVVSFFYGNVVKSSKEELIKVAHLFAVFSCVQKKSHINRTRQCKKLWAWEGGEVFAICALYGSLLLWHNCQHIFFNWFWLCIHIEFRDENFYLRSDDGDQ